MLSSKILNFVLKAQNTIKASIVLCRNGQIEADNRLSRTCRGALLAIRHQKAQKSSSRFWPESSTTCRRNLVF